MSKVTFKRRTCQMTHSSKMKKLRKKV